MIRSICAIVCVLSLTHSCSIAISKDVELFVSTSGDDKADGLSSDTPLATLHEAQRKARSIRLQSEDGANVTVWIGAGIYELSETLEFTEEDSGDEKGEIVFQSMPGQSVTVRGGVSLTEDLLVKNPKWPVSLPKASRKHTLVFDLSTVCNDKHNSHARRALHSEMQPAGLEVFTLDGRLHRAGWPNRGWATIEQLDRSGSTWKLPLSAPANVEQTEQIFAHGFWHSDWQDACEPIDLHRDSNGQWHAHLASVTEQPVRQQSRYRIENWLSQLDSPGEWYFDTTNHLMYVWPEKNKKTSPSDHDTADPTDPSSKNHSYELFVSCLDTVISAYDVNGLTLKGLTIECARSTAVEIAGGKDVSIEECTIRHTGNMGINIFCGDSHRVAHCVITGTGAGGIRVEGGDRDSLVPCQHVIEHNQIYDYAQLQLCYRPGVNVYGVGVQVENNAIFNAPHAAVQLHGSEHRVAFNDIHHVCTETADAGAIYIGHNPTFRGNFIHGNHIHDLGGFHETDVIGVYLDDFASETTVTNNVFERAIRGVAIGGGRDNRVENNVFIDCLAAVQIDSRGTTWAADYLRGEDSEFQRFTKEIPADSYFAQRYPRALEALTDNPELPKGNRIERNLYNDVIGIDLQDQLDNSIVQVKDNLPNAKSLLVNVSGGKYDPRPNSPAQRIGFEAIDFDNIGPRTADTRFVRTPSKKQP